MQLFERVNVTAIVLAAGTDIAAVIGAITNSMNSQCKGVGKGLQEIKKKTASSARS